MEPSLWKLLPTKERHEQEGRRESPLSREGSASSTAEGAGLLAHATGTALLRGGGVVLAFLTSIVLARTLGPEGYGIVAYVLSWTAVLGAVAGLGVDRIVVREVSAARERGVLAVARGLVRETSRVTAATGLCTVLLAGGVVLLLDLSPVLTLAFLVALPLAVVEPLSRLRMSALQGLDRIILGQIPDLLVRPGLMLVGMLLAWGLGPSPLHPTAALALALFSGGVGWALGDLLLQRELRDVPVAPVPPWLALAAPLLLVQILHVITNRADVILLGMFRDPAEVGVFNVAARLAELLGMALIATNFVLAPRLARAWTREDREESQDLLTRATRGVALTSLVLALLVGLGGPWILILYGPEFAPAYLPLLVLVAGRLVSAAYGSVGLVLVTAGREKDLLTGVAVGAGVNLALNLLLIPPYGAMGAATATSLGIAAWNGVLGFLVLRRTGLVPGPLGRLP